MLEVGITERGDPALHFEWVPKLRPKANIVISKGMNNVFTKHLLENKHRIIYHCTCTGWGGSSFEPNVMDPSKMYEWVRHLLEQGFPAEQIVLRIDPIIHVPSGIDKVSRVLDLFSDIGITRVRYSYVDLYRHVMIRIEKAGISKDIFFPLAKMVEQCNALFDSYSDTYEFESCAEGGHHKLGCISQKDLDILGVTEELIGRKGQRAACLCPANKVELLSNMRQCPHKCIYCYWTDK